MKADMLKANRVWKVVLTSFCLNPTADKWVKLNAAPTEEVQVMQENINQCFTALPPASFT